MAPLVSLAYKPDYLAERIVMLVIRSDQIEALTAAASEDLNQRLIAFLREEMPVQTSDYDDRALLDLICEAKQKAKSFNILSDAGIAQFMCLTLAAGLEFWEEAAVTAYLNAPGDDTEERLNNFVECLAEYRSLGTE